ncbi:MAG: hypothetical protein IPH13_18820 [Planctomycetes bacterium]|nr:hypothetical protein [Planctomycetota bacterium]MCC7171567.1 hypothetical protein [Planctomycetota bacterium]
MYDSVDITEHRPAFVPTPVEEFAPEEKVIVSPDRAEHKPSNGLRIRSTKWSEKAVEKTGEVSPIHIAMRAMDSRGDSIQEWVILANAQVNRSQEGLVRFDVPAGERFVAAARGFMCKELVAEESFTNTLQYVTLADANSLMIDVDISDIDSDGGCPGLIATVAFDIDERVNRSAFEMRTEAKGAVPSGASRFGSRFTVEYPMTDDGQIMLRDLPSDRSLAISVRDSYYTIIHEEHIVLDCGGARQIAISTPRSPCRLGGRLLGPESAPVRDAPFRAVSDLNVRYTKADGAFEFQNVYGDSVEVIVDPPGRSRVRATLRRGEPDAVLRLGGE